jgi:Plavaka transposase
MSNPLFKEHMSFTAEQHFTKEGVRRYGEIHWSTFWWETQDQLETGATIVPILLGIDETHVNLLGRMKVHPLYMTIGNIHKKIRRTYSQNAYRVLAYFPELKGTKQEREQPAFKLAKKNLYHMCMSECLNQLREYGKQGCILKGPDGKL